MLGYIFGSSVLLIFIGFIAFLGCWYSCSVSPFSIKTDYSRYKEYKALKNENKITQSIEMSHGSAYYGITQQIYGLHFILIGLIGLFFYAIGSYFS